MALSPEQEWTLVGCGLIAHADDVLEVGEWDQILRIVNATLTDEESEDWLARLTDREALEKYFADLEPPLPHVREELLHKAWRMALADGYGSEVEAAVHDRIAERVGVDSEQVAAWREDWNKRAADCAELVAAFAAALANLDGSLDSAEAMQFDSLLERMPVSPGRRLQLTELLYNPPAVGDVAERMIAMPEEDRLTVLYDVAPLVHASHRGDRERQVFLELADKAAVARDRAEALLEA